MSLIDKLEDLVVKVDTEYQEKMEAVIREIVPGMPEGNVRHAAECMCTDRNLDINNIMDLYKVLSFHKPQTQIIAVIHNPALIYKLSKLDCVNFIEMTKGYLKKITGFMNKK